VIAPDEPFWTLPIGDPGPEQLFDDPVYLRGAMTLHALRLEVGDVDFFKILRTWPKVMTGKNVDTAAFVRFAERVSGQQLDDLFQTWLYEPSKPAVPAPAAAARTAVATAVPVVAHAQMVRWGLTLK
jgi:aminopeptidase N